MFRSRRDFDVGASAGRISRRTSYIIVDLQSWADLATYSWYWGARRGIALNILAVLTKWRKQERRLNCKGGIGVDIRGRWSLSGGILLADGRIGEVEVDDVPRSMRGKRIEMVMKQFVNEFEGKDGCER